MENFFSFLWHLIRSGALESTFNATNPSGLLILFSLAVVTDIGIPVPFVLDTILLFTAYGVLTSPHPNFAPILLIVLALFVGRQLGSGILYLISRMLGGPFINWLKCHVPSIGNRLDSFKARLTHLAPLVVTTGRLTPGLLQVTSVVCGAVRLNYSQFALGIALSSLIYDGILVLLGFFAAHSPASQDPNLALWLLITLIVIVAILWPLIFFVFQRSSKKTVPTKNC
jgi:membrane protein DedA with SNARE-associated domain